MLTTKVDPRTVRVKRYARLYSFLKGLAQAKIIKKSVIFYGFLKGLAHAKIIKKLVILFWLLKGTGPG